MVRALVVRPSDQDEQLFALIGMNPNRIDSDCIVRMEPFDRGSALRPEDRSQTRNSTTVDNCRRLRSGGTFSGLLRTKPLFGMTAFEFERRTVVAIAGQDGEVQLIDAGACKSWPLGSEGGWTATSAASPGESSAACRTYSVATATACYFGAMP